MAQRYPKELKEQVLLDVKEIGSVAQYHSGRSASAKKVFSLKRSYCSTFPVQLFIFARHTQTFLSISL